ncbi:MAG TPA: YhjD/YihY/BrkB family envelope integrity protein [Ktedonobacterales bacterium]|jgi:YihY family inner membrane protein|nr:YhjD/YihY/BrkB family envelope integrity protein [Ktedonobacterales bacterium]
MAQTQDGVTSKAASNEIGTAKREAKKATSFWAKISEDWALNFSGMLAYNYLTAIAPILLAVLAIAGLILGTLSPATYNTFVHQLSTNFPAGAGGSFVNNSLAALRKDAGVLLIIAIVTAIFSGSRLFVALDNVFAVIYRVDVRPFLRQNIMAILMMLLFLVLAPLSFFASSIPGTVLSFVLPSGIQSNAFVLTVEGFIGGVIVGFIMFAAIYFVVPNRRVSWATTWPGALTVAVLLNLFEVLFPIYQRLFLKNAGLGSAAGLAVVILIFLYYVGVITLLGAEINAWASGLRPLGKTLPQLFRDERREGVGNAPGAPTTGVSRTPPPTHAGGTDTGSGRPDAGRAAPRPSGAQRPAHALVATPRDSVSASGKVGRIARPFAAVTTVGAMLSAGAALALRRMTRPAQPSI